MYSPSRAHSPVHRLHSRGAPKSYRRFFSSSRSFRLHPIFLIPIFLLGTLFSPFRASSKEESLEVVPVYRKEDYLFQPEKVFLKPDAPPLDFLQDDLSISSSGSSGSSGGRGSGEKVLARTGHGKGSDESEWWDPTTLTTYSSNNDDNDDEDSSSQKIYHEREGLLYFQSNSYTIPSLEEKDLQFPPPPVVVKRPALAQVQPLSDPLTPPPPPSDWLAPGDFYKSPLERTKSPPLQRYDALNAPLPPPPPPRNNLPRRVPYQQRVLESEKEALSKKKLGKNAIKAQQALKNGKGFVPLKPEELVIAEKEYKKILEKKKKEEIDKRFRNYVWAEVVVEPEKEEKKVLGVEEEEDDDDDDGDADEEEEKEEVEEEEELSDLEILKAVKELSDEERKFLSREEQEVIKQLEAKYPPLLLEKNEKPPTRVQEPQPQGRGAGQRRGNFRDREKFNPLGQPGREGRRRGGGGLRKRSLAIEDDNQEFTPAEEEEEREREHSKRSLNTDSPPRLPHPISLLISQAEERWESMLRRQSQTLEQAVQEYKLRYGLPPPVGFDSWWRYAMENRIILVDEYDQIDQDFKLFRSLSPNEFRKRSKQLQTDSNLPWFKHSFGLGIKTGQIKKYGDHSSASGDGGGERAEDLMDLLAEFAEMIPEDVELRFMKGDEPGIVVSGEAKQRHLDYASQGKFLSPIEAQEMLEPSGLTPWDSLCLPNSTARRKSRALQTNEPVGGSLKSFINLNPIKGIDLCLHPELKNLNGFTSSSNGPRPFLLYPLFSSSKTSLHSDLLIPSISSDFYTPVGKDPLWEGKKFNKVFWRGETTGSWYSRGSGWKNNQRARLVTLANSQDETSSLTIHFTTDEEESIVRTPNPIPLTSLTSFYLDVAFSGKPLQCSNLKFDQTCKELLKDPELRFDHQEIDKENQYKYVLDVDGNYISGKFKRLMSSRSLVFKSTIFPEWWSKRIMPWYHYVPIKSDYSDLLDISAFFIGQPDSQKTGNHDFLAKKIALRGQKWSNEHWREVDMAAYMFRLYLEYARLLHRDENDPTSMDYSG
ncbi:hypothetical protein JCM3765_007015 [Sporobolomyces pararoseus]